MNNRVGLVILAAGKGKRMQEEAGNELPKVLQPLHGKPLIRHLIEGLRGAPVMWPPVIVIGFKGELVERELGPEFTYVRQEEQLGTGHATLQARPALEGKVEHVLVLYGDHPLVPLSVVEAIVMAHVEHDNTLMMATVTVPDFEDWRVGLLTYGHIVCDDAGKPTRIIEYKDATEAERAIRTVNPGYYCFRAEWLWPHLEQLKNENAQGEYYLTDLLGMAIAEGARVETVGIDAKAALGVNTVAELKRLEGLV
ncbi:MAG: NTP transferase domain-containing protein [Patescibacteria group bacterium]